MGLRIKILSGFIILALMLVIAGVWTILEIKNTGFSIQAIFDENYQSIFAGEDMIEALEREDSGILLLLLGKWEKGREQLFRADSLFNKKLEFAYSNGMENLKNCGSVPLSIHHGKGILNGTSSRYMVFSRM